MALVFHRCLIFVFQFIHGNVKDCSSCEDEKDETDHKIDFQMDVTEGVKALHKRILSGTRAFLKDTIFVERRRWGILKCCSIVVLHTKALFSSTICFLVDILQYLLLNFESTLLIVLIIVFIDL